MKKISILFLFILSACSFCNAQTTLKGFTKLVYHSSYCFGSCPKIDMQIDSKRNIYVYRDSDAETAKLNGASAKGYFKGVLDVKTYNRLLKTLLKSKYNRQQWPDVTCCDAVVTTIIVYVNNKRTYLRSMTPPKQANELIDLLFDIGLQTPLQPTNEKKELEE